MFHRHLTKAFFAPALQMEAFPVLNILCDQGLSELGLV